MAGETITADILLRWITDKGTQSQALKAIQEIEKAAVGAGKTFKSSFGKMFSKEDLEVGREVSQVAKQWGGDVAKAAQAMEGSALAAGKNRFELMDLADGYREATRAAAEASKQAEQFTKSTNQATRGVNRFGAGMGGFLLSFTIGRPLQQFGRTVLSPIEQFVDQMGETTEIGTRWTDATERIEGSISRIGGAMATEILPTLEKLADFTEKLADLIESNPDLAKGAAGLGIGAFALGSTLVAIGNTISAIGGLRLLGVLGPGAGGAGTGLGTGAVGAAKAVGTVTLIASSVVIGAELGKELGNALGRLAYGEDYQEQGLRDAALTATRIGALPALLWSRRLQELDGSLGELGEQMEDNVGRADEFINALLGLSDATEGAKAAAERPSQAAIDAYVNFVKANNEAEQQYMTERQNVINAGLARIAQLEANYASQRAQIIESYNQQRSNAIENFELQQANAAAQFALTQSRALEDYYLRRQQLVEDYDIQAQRAEEDHRREMLRMERDSNDRIAELAAKRDALGIRRELRDRERRRQDAEDEYRTEARQRNQDMARRIDQMEQQFRLEHARRAQDYQIRQEQAQAQFELQQEQAEEQFQARLEQLAEQHKAEMEQAEQATRDKLAALQQEYFQERVTRRNAFLDQLRDIQDTLLYEKNTRLAYYQAMERDLVDWLESMQGAFGSNLPEYPTETHQAGGYGPGYTGPGEFVLTRSTTNMLERIAGGGLTQGSILGLGGPSVSLSMNIRYDGRISAADRVEIRNLSESAALLGVRRALQGA